MKTTFPHANELVSKGLGDVCLVLTHRCLWNKAAEAFKIMKRREGTKVIVTYE